jgi:serine phosphatase RsbU (regulator of sigma subunit)/DNA-binding NarL/FixJ family response regulator
MSERKPIRLVTVDDLPLMRSGLREFLTAYEEFSLVGEASNGEEAIQLCELLSPDMVLMDLKMPLMDGVTATRQIRQRWPGIKVMALVSFRDKELINQALEAGAAGYALKDVTADELAETVRRVYSRRRGASLRLKQDTGQAELLERLAQAMDQATADRTRLAGLLRSQLPGLFPGCQIEVRLFPNQSLLYYPADRSDAPPEGAWRWLQTRLETQVFDLSSPMPWSSEHPVQGQMMLAVLTSNSGHPLGGICIWHHNSDIDLWDHLGFVKALAGKVSQAVEKGRWASMPARGQFLEKELANAGKIQSGILPEKPPFLRGWDLASRLEPALQTSGDFYDFIPLSNQNWGFVIADVSDKGMGAALFMALSSTLFRTYATQYATLPSFAITQINERILSDTRSEMFVTAFYGVLEPGTGRMRYVNAGHNPPYLISGQKGKPFDRLRATGMALGVMEDTVWKQKVVRFSPGDVLLLYTDGITEAQDPMGRFYGERRLQDVLRSIGSRPAEEILQAVLDDLRGFIAGAPQQDDVTLIVIRRLPER